jgi:glycerophosphoryl diester phosphodiesterase
MKTWLIIGIALLTLVILFSWICRGIIVQKMQPAPETKSLKNKDFKIIAHRGASGNAPENTMAAFKKALHIGVDMIELDIHLSKDGKIVVIHDELLDRTTNGTGLIKDLNYEDIAKYDAGSWFGKEYSNEKVPLLEEVLTLIDGKTTVLIELKRAKQFVYNGIEEKLVALINEHQAQSWCILQSFERTYIEKLHQLAPQLEYHLLIVSDLDPLPVYADNYFSFHTFLEQPFYKAINPANEFLTKGKVEAIQQQGLRVFTYTVNEEDKMKKIINMGVNGIISNVPDRLVALKKQLQ